MPGTSLQPRYSSNSIEGASRAIHRDVLSISLLGTMSLSFNGQHVRIKSRKSRALLAFLALSESRQETRERLVGLFWSESEEHKARASLRQTLRELRQVLFEVGYRGLQTEKLAIELDPNGLEVDLWSVIHEADQHRAHPLLLNMARAAEHILEGFEDIDPQFRVWLLAKRQTFQDRLIRGLEAGLFGIGGDARTKKRLAEAIINLDPTHEEACRSLMLARALEGDISGALRVYKTLWDLLDDEYGMEPSAKTQQLVAEIKQGHIERESASPSPGATDASSRQRAAKIHVAEIRRGAGPDAIASMPSKIALLVGPFQMNGVSPEKVHLVDGFRHHLIASLIRFREWSVVDGGAPHSGFHGKPAGVAQYGIDATAYQVGDTANVVLTLRQNETNTFIWSETFELKLENWFQAQQRVIRRTTTSLNVQLSTERLMRLAGEPDVSLTVYDRWLRGQTMMWRFHQGDWDRSAQIFEDTIRDAPNFSPGYSSLAGWNNAIHIAQPGVFRDLERTRNNVELARKAVQLDALDARAQLCLGWAYAMAKQYVQAEPHMDLARELNDSDPWMRLASSLFYSFRGKFDLAGTLADEAFEMKLAPSPTDWAYLVSVRFLTGDYEAAIDAADRAQDVIRTLRAWKAAALYHLGRKEQAHAEAAHFLAAIKSFWFGSMPPTEETIARWFLHLYPISEKPHWERLRAGIIGAGIPVSGIEHHAW